MIQLRTDRLADVAHSARVLGAAVGRSASGLDTVAAELERALAAERVAAAADSSPTPALLLAWDQPVIALGAGSFVSELLELAGGRNVFADIAVPSAPVSLEAIADRPCRAAARRQRDAVARRRADGARCRPYVRPRDPAHRIRIQPFPSSPPGDPRPRARLAALTTDALAGEP